MAEERVREAFSRGEALDFRAAEGEDARLGAGWAPERTVRAEVLTRLLLDEPRAAGEIPALRIAGVRIVGPLYLLYGQVECTVSFLGCYFAEVPVLFGARMRRLYLGECVLPGLSAGTAVFDGDLSLEDCRIGGRVTLAGAQVAGALRLDRAEVRAGEDQGAALDLGQAAVGGALSARSLVAHGEVRLQGATVGGSLDLTEARLDHPGDTSLQATNLAVGTDLDATGLTAHGRVNLRGARIPGQLVLARAALHHPGGVALRGDGMVLGELWLRGPSPVEGTFSLRRTQVDLIHAEPEVWPDEVRLDGLAYNVLVPHEPAARRLPVLDRDADGYVPFSYEQLALAYRRLGDDTAARTVQLAKQRRHRATLPVYAQAWGHLQDATIGYGFRPVRAAGWLLSLLLTGWIAYAVRRPPALKPGEAPDFSPFFYALDLLLPLVDLGQEKAYAPEGPMQTLSYVLILAGWVLATTVAAGITRALSRA